MPDRQSNPSQVSLAAGIIAPHILAKQRSQYSLEMRNKNKEYPQILKSVHKNKICKPHQIFGLDIQQLQNEELMKNRIYRRMYNIIKNDETTIGLKFRSNLIKELFFLLKVAPYIEQSIRDRFLGKIQQLYDLNDTKKIKLSKNLDKFVSKLVKKDDKQKENSKSLHQIGKRPKTGGANWDKSLIPFLRPYTAKLKSNNKNTKEQTASTKANTLTVKEQFKGQEFLNAEQKIGCQIEQEWKRSEDFKNKHRTLHPEQQPSYQKLFSLIQKVKLSSNSLFSDKNNRYNNLNQSTQFSFKKYEQDKKKRNIQSANLESIKTFKTVSKKKIKQDESFNGEGAEQSGQLQSEQQNEQGEEIVKINPKHKKFRKDRIQRGNKIKQNSNSLYSSVNNLKILRPFAVQQTHIINKLEQYSSLQQNKKVIQNRDDLQCIQKVQQYLRNKVISKKQNTRRIQSKDYMSNFSKFVKITHSNKNAQNQKKSQTEFHQKKLKVKSISQPKLFDMRQNCQENIKTPKFSSKTYHYKKSKGINIDKQRVFCQKFDKKDSKSTIQGLTCYKRILPEEIFDPGHKDNIQIYNKNAIEEIELIKQKLAGKCLVSVDCLTKALCIDKKIKQDNSFNIDIPDKKYLMVEKQEKKKLKKIKKRGFRRG